MGQHLISIAALLLSLTAGTFLLAKTKKEDLGVFYKVVAWFVIAFSILLIFCSAVRCIAGRECKMENGCNQGEMMFMGHSGMMRGGEDNENCFSKNRHHREEGEDEEEDCKDMEKCHKGEGREAGCCKRDSIMKK
jgi:hypothetical protein